MHKSRRRRHWLGWSVLLGLCALASCKGADGAKQTEPAAPPAAAAPSDAAAAAPEPEAELPLLPAPVGAETFEQARDMVRASVKSKDTAALALIMSEEFEYSHAQDSPPGKSSRREALDYWVEFGLLDDLARDLKRCKREGDHHVCGEAVFSRERGRWFLSSYLLGD